MRRSGMPQPKLRRAALANRVQAHLECARLDLAIAELFKFEATRCRARTRRGTLCERKKLPSGRCPNHGGLSTGPKTREGKLRALANLRQFRTQR